MNTCRAISSRVGNRRNPYSVVAAPHASIEREAAPRPRVKKFLASGFAEGLALLRS
jgi:hypothetical protein